MSNEVMKSLSNEKYIFTNAMNNKLQIRVFV